jgi:hypothetical protein
MKIRYRYGNPIPERLLTLEDPGRPLAFDADRGLIEELSQQCDVKSFVGGLKGKSRDDAEADLRAFGERLMEATIELADGKYLDRAGEMIEKVAEQTGISFPHRLERYVELSIIGSRPLDRWNVTKATTKELTLEVFSCAVLREMQEAGLVPDGGLCHALCLASFQAAARKTGDKVNMSVAKSLPQDGLCQFSFVHG